MNRKLSNLFKKFRYVRKNREDEQQKVVSENETKVRSELGQASPVDVFNHSSKTSKKEKKKVNDMNEEELDKYCNEKEHIILYKLMEELDESCRPKKNRREGMFRGDCVPEEYAVVIQVISRVHLDFNFCNETLFYTVDLARRYLNIVAKPVTASDFVVVLFTSLFISSKFEEVDHLFIDELLQLAKKYRYFAEVFKTQIVREIRRKFRYADIQDLEVKMITKLRFKPVNRAISFWFGREYYNTKNQLDEFECRLCQFILESTLFNFSTILKFSNKEIGAAAVNLVSKITSSSQANTKMAIPMNSSKKKIEECESVLIRTLQDVIENQYNRHRNRKIFPKERDFVVKNFKKLNPLKKKSSVNQEEEEEEEEKQNNKNINNNNGGIVIGKRIGDDMVMQDLDDGGIIVTGTGSTSSAPHPQKKQKNKTVTKKLKKIPSRKKITKKKTTKSKKNTKNGRGKKGVLKKRK